MINKKRTLRDKVLRGTLAAAAIIAGGCISTPKPIKPYPDWYKGPYITGDAPKPYPDWYKGPYITGYATTPQYDENNQYSSEKSSDLDNAVGTGVGNVLRSRGEVTIGNLAEQIGSLPNK